MLLIIILSRLKFLKEGVWRIYASAMTYSLAVSGSAPYGYGVPLAGKTFVHKSCLPPERIST